MYLSHPSASITSSPKVTGFDKWLVMLKVERKMRDSFVWFEKTTDIFRGGSERGIH